MVNLTVDPLNPKTIRVANSLFGPVSGWADMGSYPIGTTLIVTVAWDKANQQFVSAVYSKDDPSEGVRVVTPYFASDDTLPVWSQRSLNNSVQAANCTSEQAFADNRVVFRQRDD